MAELLSRLDFYEIGRRFILSRAQRIEPDVVDTEGSDANLFVGSISFIAHAISRQLAERINALLLDGAEREDLDRYAFDRYQLTRKGAAPARGHVIFSRSTITAGAGSVPVSTKLRSLTGIEYITLTEAVFGVSTLVSLSVKVRAVQAGKDFQVGKNQIRSIPDIATLWDKTLIVTNEAATAGGENAEEDDEFRERIRDFWNTARRGTLKAIEFGAKTVPGVSSAMAVEALNSSAQPARVVNLFIADSSGVASAALGAEVVVELEDFRAAGIAVIVSLSIPQIVTVQMALTFIAGVDTSTLTEAVRAAIFEYINSLAVNQTLLRAGLFSILQRFASDGLVVKDSTFIEPAGDLVPTPGQTLRTTLTNITAN